VTESPLSKAREPAAAMAPARPKPRRASARRWDRENPATGYRLTPETVQQIRDVQAWYQAHDYRVSQSQIVEDLLTFALAAWDEGQVEIHVQEIQPAGRPIGRNGQEQ
jgi:hypothetical protein